MSSFQTQSGAFLRWFASQPGATFLPTLELTDLRFRSAGRGIIAKEDIPAETDLFTIPRESIINTQNSDLSKRLPSLFNLPDEADGDQLEDGGEEEMPKSWLNLILVLMYESLQGERSRWKPYLDILPQPDDFTTLMFWNEQEINELQASAVRNKIGKESADRMFQRAILPVVKRHQDVFFQDSASQLDDKALLHLAHRMGSVIMAYAFHLENDDESQDEDEEDGWIEDRENQSSMGMVPMADMLNADAEFNAHLSHGEHSLTMTSLRTIKAGEEVLNYYGPLPNCELLRRYGYTSPKHARYDVVELSYDLIKSALEGFWMDEKYKIGLNEEDVEESFVLERDAGDPDSTGQLTYPARFTTFPEELLELINSANAAALNIDLEQPKVPESDRRAIKKAFAEVMMKVLVARYAQYVTTIEEDIKLLEQEVVAAKVRMAIDVRLGEKRLLKEALELVEEMLRKRPGGGPKHSEPPAKKQKTSK